MRTAAWETAPQTALKNCSKEVGEGQYISDSSEWSEGLSAAVSVHTGGGDLRKEKPVD